MFFKLCRNHFTQKKKGQRIKRYSLAAFSSCHFFTSKTTLHFFGKVFVFVAYYMAKLPTKIYTGISGLLVPGNQSTYPPAFQGKSRLAYYAHFFNSIEINSSFYKTPQPKTVAKWGESVPANFRFTFKLSKAITHSKGLEYDEKELEKFMNSVAEIGDKKGCLLIQFPGSFRIDKLDKLQQLLSDIEWYNEGQWQLAIEFRHLSWYEQETTEILQEYNAITVWQDKPAAATPTNITERKKVYVRLHGPEGNYKGDYEDAFLKSLAKKMKPMQKNRQTVYCYFNNTMGSALQNLQLLNKYLGIKSGDNSG